jgi:hypothetical protein
MRKEKPFSEGKESHVGCSFFFFVYGPALFPIEFYMIIKR